MKFNIGRPPKHIRKEQKRKALHEWHSKFAWWPTIVDEADETYSRVWFEKYMRQQRIGPTSLNDPGDGSYFVKYSKKEYFKKKLNGDFEFDRDPWAGEETQADTNMAYQGSGSVGHVLKKGGPTTNTNIRRVVIGSMDEDIKIYDENGNETEL